LLGLSVPSILGPLLLLASWGIVGYDIYLKRQIRTHLPEKVLSEGYYQLRAENEQLKIQLIEEHGKIQGETNALLKENSALKARIAEANRSSTPIVALNPISTPVDTSTLEERIFVNESPVFLTRFFDNRHTQVQAQTLAQPYLKKWMRMSGVKVEDILQYEHTKQYAIRGDSQGVTVFLRFALDWSDRVLVVPLASTIDVIGQIVIVDKRHVSFENCEIMNGRP
jgi:hypothetical protein